jgi:hypothetical protein
MDRMNCPTKEQVRAWLAERRQAGQSPPNCEQIRQQLRWNHCATGVRLHAAIEQLEGPK